MDKGSLDISPLVYARVAGLLALITLVLGTFASRIHSSLVVYGDPSATMNNIIGSELLFRLGIVSSLAMYTIFIVYALLLYKLLKPVSQDIAALMLTLALVGVPIAMLNQINNAAVLQLLDGGGFLDIIGADQTEAHVMLFLRLHGYGNLIGVIFWGLWLLPLGWLVYKSGYFPAILGILLMIGCFGWLTVFIQRFLLPDIELLAYARYATHIAELCWLLWLLIKGLNLKKWKERAHAMAKV